MVEKLLRLPEEPALLAEARLARRLPNWLAVCLLGPVFIFGSGLIGSIPAALLLVLEGHLSTAADAPQTPLDQSVLLVLSFAPLFLMLWAWLRLYEKRPFWSLGLRADRWAARYLRGFLLGTGMFALVMLGLWSTGQVRFHPQPVAGWQTGLAAGLILAGWLVQGPG